MRSLSHRPRCTVAQTKRTVATQSSEACVPDGAVGGLAPHRILRVVPVHANSEEELRQPVMLQVLLEGALPRAFKFKHRDAGLNLGCPGVEPLSWSAGCCPELCTDLVDCDSHVTCHVLSVHIDVLGDEELLVAGGGTRHAPSDHNSAEEAAVPH